MVANMAKKEVRCNWSEEFPTFWWVVLVLAGVWFMEDMGWLGANFSFPWFPAILVIVAIGAIINRRKK